MTNKNKTVSEYGALCKTEYNQYVAMQQINPNDYDVWTLGEDWIAVKSSSIDPIERLEEVGKAFAREEELNPRITLRDIVFSDDPYSIISKLSSEKKEFVEGLLRHSTIEDWKAIFRGQE